MGGGTRIAAPIGVATAFPRLLITFFASLPIVAWGAFGLAKAWPEGNGADAASATPVVAAAATATARAVAPARRVTPGEHALRDPTQGVILELDESALDAPTSSEPEANIADQATAQQPQAALATAAEETTAESHVSSQLPAWREAAPAAEAADTAVALPDQSVMASIYGAGPGYTGVGAGEGYTGVGAGDGFTGYGAGSGYTGVGAGDGFTGYGAGSGYTGPFASTSAYQAAMNSVNAYSQAHGAQAVAPIVTLTPYVVVPVPARRR